VLRFGWALGPAVLLMTTLAIICISFYRIDREAHATTLREIRQSSAG
jgi:Na+/melibiose symporter-like transporter